jgi:hypothetical protein
LTKSSIYDNFQRRVERKIKSHLPQNALHGSINFHDLHQPGDGNHLILTTAKQKFNI